MVRRGECSNVPFATWALKRPNYSSGDAGAEIVAIQIPTATAPSPTIKLKPILSPIANAPTIDAKIGLTVIVTAVLVGVVRESANTQRMKAPAPPNTPR